MIDNATELKETAHKLVGFVLTDAAMKKMTRRQILSILKIVGHAISECMDCVTLETALQTGQDARESQEAAES